MRLRTILQLLCLPPMRLGMSFLSSLVGHWTVHKPMIIDPVIFVVHDTRVESITESSHLEMLTSETETVGAANETILVYLDSLRVVQKPKDWYNLSKYAHFLKYFYRIRHNGLCVEIRMLDAARISVNCSSNGTYLGSMVLHRA